MNTYTYKTDAESGTIQAVSLAAALAQVRPTDAEIEDGAWAWVEDPDTGERESIGR